MTTQVIRYHGARAGLEGDDDEEEAEKAKEEKLAQQAAAADAAAAAKEAAAKDAAAAGGDGAASAAAEGDDDMLDVDESEFDADDLDKLAEEREVRSRVLDCVSGFFWCIWQNPIW